MGKVPVLCGGIVEILKREQEQENSVPYVFPFMYR